MVYLVSFVIVVGILGTIFVIRNKKKEEEAEEEEAEEE